MVSAIVEKDLRLEFRTRYALAGILLFALTSIAATSWVLKGSRLQPEQSAAVAWIIILFAAVSGLSRPFVQEAETGTEGILRQSASAEAIWTGKLVFAFLIMLSVVAVVFPAYSLLMDAALEDKWRLVWVSALGCLALSAGTTLLSAIVAKAQAKSLVFAVAALPILLPALSFVVQASLPSFGVNDVSGSADSAAIALFSYTGIIGVVSWFLFPVVWTD